MTTTATNQPLHRQLTKPAGRSFLNEALEEGAKRRVFTSDAAWSTSVDEDAPPAPGEESQKAMSAAVREAAGYSTTNEEEPNNA